MPESNLNTKKLPRLSDKVILSGFETRNAKFEGMMSNAPAIYVAGSTSASLIPATGVRDFDKAEVWELPWVTVTDITRGNKDEWRYPGCSVCLKSQCTTHAEQRRPCCAAELHGQRLKQKEEAVRIR